MEKGRICNRFLSVGGEAIGRDDPAMNTPPLSDRLIWLDRAAARVADLLIRGYQKWLSPLKGPHRACAHRVLHGGDSCSQHARALIAESGLLAAAPRAFQRFAACQQAAAVTAPLRGTSAPLRRRHRGQCCIVIPLPACSTTRTIRR